MLKERDGGGGGGGGVGREERRGKEGLGGVGGGRSSGGASGTWAVGHLIALGPTPPSHSNAPQVPAETSVSTAARLGAEVPTVHSTPDPWAAKGQLVRQA